MKKKIYKTVLSALAFASIVGEAKILPETLFIVQTQLYPWREQARGYLMRYPNQPLLVEPDLPYDKGEEGIDHWIAGWGSFPKIVEMEPTDVEMGVHAASVVVADFGTQYAGLNGQVEVPVIMLTGEENEPINC